jgi:hypothetical protein
LSDDTPSLGRDANQALGGYPALFCQPAAEDDIVGAQRPDGVFDVIGIHARALDDLLAKEHR